MGNQVRINHAHAFLCRHVVCFKKLNLWNVCNKVHNVFSFRSKKKPSPSPQERLQRIHVDSYRYYHAYFTHVSHLYLYINTETMWKPSPRRYTMPSRHFKVWFPDEGNCGKARSPVKDVERTVVLKEQPHPTVPTAHRGLQSPKLLFLAFQADLFLALSRAYR